jgi:hypothetical protein
MPAPRPKQRKSLTTTTTGGISVGGAPALAEAVGAAMAIARRGQDAAQSLTHPFHSYPARMHPATACALVELVSKDRKTGALLVDPFCGSGTTLVEAKAAGLRSIGIDLNPLAVLIASAKTWTVSKDRRAMLRQSAHAISGIALLAGKNARRANVEAEPLRKPKGFDPNARDRRLARWFSPHVRRELEALAAGIDPLRTSDPELGNVLTAVLSSILYKVSSRTSDTDPTWIDRKIARGASCRLFVDRTEALARGLAELAGLPGPRPEVFEDDARNVSRVVGAGKASAVVCSPPYAGTYDYAEQQRLRFDFLGLRHRDIDSGEIGSRRSFAQPTAAEPSWHQALCDMFDSFAQVLRPGGRAAIVIGDSLAGKLAHFALDDVRATVPDELQVVAWASQQRPILGAAERSAFGERGKHEHVILLSRVE